MKKENKGINVLFIYPNTFGMNMLPPAIATFAAILKERNHQVQVFDTTYYSIDFGIDSDGSKEDRLSVVPYSAEMEKKNLLKLNGKETIYYYLDLKGLVCANIQPNMLTF